MNKYTISREDLVTNNYDNGINCDVPTDGSKEATSTAVIMPEAMLALILDDLIKAGAAK